MDLTRFEKMRPKGRIVVLDGGVAAYVFPVGVRHLQRFSSTIGDGLRKLASITVPKGTSAEDAKSTLAVAAIPILIDDLLDLVKETTVLGLVDQDDAFYPDATQSIGDLEHWLFPPLLEAWIDLSFGEEKKYRPWLAAVEKTFHRLTGQRISISEMFSKASSRRGIDSKTSSS